MYMFVRTCSHVHTYTRTLALVYFSLPWLRDAKKKVMEEKKEKPTLREISH